MPTLRRSNLKTAVVDPQTQWTRCRLQLLLGAVVVIVLAVVAGGIWSARSMLTLGFTATHDSGTDGAGASAQDQLANEPLPQAPLEAAQPGSLSSGKTGTLRIPAATGVGPAAVATGFPHTPHGALAQLAAIDQAALSSASVRVAQEVISQWAAPGGPTTQNWSGVKAVAALLESGGMPADGSGSITVTVEPSMGFIKGTVGDGFVIPCIDFVIAATTTAGRPQQVAAADCQRMVWQHHSRRSAGGRWLIGPGEEPAAAPSLWPGSQESFDAGYQWLEYTS